MNALQLLHDDHERIRGLFELLEKTQIPAEKLALFQEVKDKLEEYTEFEDELLFPLLRKHGELDNMLEERYQENQEIRDLLEDIDDDLAAIDDDGDDEFDTPDDLLSELAEATEAHLEMEELELFSKVRELETDEELDRIGNELVLARAS